MKFTVLGAAALAFVASASPASAITVDGNRDAGYGAAKSTVTYDPAQASYNFGAPAPYSELANYSIYLSAGQGFVYGYLEADRVTGFPFANLYFDLDPANGNGSDLGFEITNDRAFVPGMSGYAENLAGLTFATNVTGTGVEFAIANSLFTSYIPGLTYYADQELPGIGDAVTLRLSQSFGYAVAGGATYGPNRLGTINLAAVPEPATWGMMIGGMGLAGGALRNRRKAKIAFA